MGLKTLFERERGVSPVIAVILMVAITVILSAVIGSFVLDIGSDLNESPPQAQFTAEQDDDYILEDNQGEQRKVIAVQLTHAGGEQIDPKQIRVTVNGIPGYTLNHHTDSSYPLHWENGPNWNSNSYVEAQVIEAFEEQRHTDGMIVAGDTDTIVMKTKYFEQTGAAIRGSSDLKKVYAFNGGDSFFYDAGNADNDGDNYVDEGSHATSRLESGDTIRIVYESTEGNSQILYEYEVK